MKGIALDNTPGRGRKKSLPKVAIIIISKSFNKKQQSTRKLTKRLKRNGITVSHMTVQRYLKTTIGAKSYKRPLMPRLSPKQKENRLTFCKQENFCRTCYRLHFPTVWSPCSPCHKDTGFVQRTSKGILGERYLAKQLPRLDLNREFVGYCAKQPRWYGGNKSKST